MILFITGPITIIETYRDQLCYMDLWPSVGVGLYLGVGQVELQILGYGDSVKKYQKLDTSMGGVGCITGKSNFLYMEV